jgi:hypothetical protein
MKVFGMLIYSISIIYVIVCSIKGLKDQSESDLQIKICRFSKYF